MTESAGSGQSLSDAGEREVLKRVLAELSEARAAKLGPGDDCAVLRFDGDAVVTSDTMIEGPDFRVDWHTGRELGWKLAATNLSDVAAMGAQPTALTVALAAPAETPVALFAEIAQGLEAACRALAPGCGVVGGDLARAPVLTAAVTALGELAGRAAVTRAGAAPGDAVAYAGQLGLAGMGLSLLFERADNPGDSDAVAASVAALRAAHPALLSAQLSPRPPVQLGPVAAFAGATSMLDVSDGLSVDAARIAEASDVRIDFSRHRLVAGFGEQGGESIPIEAMLYGGEDHGLLATFPADTELPRGFTQIGSVAAGSGLTFDGEALEPRGWDPFDPSAFVADLQG